MDELSPIGIIVFILILIGALCGLIYWGNLAWRHPTKFRDATFFDFFGGKQFGFYLWMYRIFTLLFGLAMLFSIVAMILTLINLTK